MTFNYREMEERIRNFWTEKEIYRFDVNHPGELYAIDTPPPYVSATQLHVGHAMSYTQADIIARYQRMTGKNVFYPIGFDDNGYPTEQFVEKHLRIDRRSMSLTKFRTLCQRVAEEQSQSYKDLFNKLGISVDWSLLYRTIDKRCQRISQLSFLDLYRKGVVERREEPTLWCHKCETALAQTDLEDKEKEATLNYLRFEIMKDNALVTVATTRPELLAGCVALLVNPTDERYRHLLRKKATTPLFDKAVPIMTDNTVDPNFGTGIMMVCTWGDQEDVRRWRQFSLETIETISAQGKLTTASGELAGLSLADAKEILTQRLRQSGDLIRAEHIKHSVKLHDRCGTAIEFLRTPQWFVKITPFLSTWESVGEKLEWYPAYMKTKYESWIHGLKWDWCISRQRHYGVPFPVWYCGSCGEIIVPNEDKLPVDPTNDPPPINSCTSCGSNKITPEKDVMDTWMTSSLTPYINCHWGEKDCQQLQQKIFPMAIRTQGFEIIRTWLFYTIVKAHFHSNSLPWRKVMITGWGVDEKGEKLSKSSGHAIGAEEIIQLYSADGLRYWAGTGNLGNNLRFSEKQLRQGRRVAIKLWNSLKLLPSHIAGDRITDRIESVPLKDSDKWVLHHLNRMIAGYHLHFTSLEYSKTLWILEHFFWKILCDNYLEIIKYRLRGEDSEDSTNAAQSTVYFVLNSVTKLFAPFLPFITEELYQHFFSNHEGKTTIHGCTLPSPSPSWDNPQVANQFQCNIEVISLLRKYKTEKSLSPKTELKAVIIKTSKPQFVDQDLISKVMNVKSIKFEETKEAELVLSVKE